MAGVARFLERKIRLQAGIHGEVTDNATSQVVGPRLGAIMGTWDTYFSLLSASFKIPSWLNKAALLIAHSRL
jgi:hypothetical protein